MLSSDSQVEESGSEADQSSQVEESGSEVDQSSHVEESGSEVDQSSHVEESGSEVESEWIIDFERSGPVYTGIFNKSLRELLAKSQEPDNESQVDYLPAITIFKLYQASWEPSLAIKQPIYQEFINSVDELSAKTDL
jgi:kynurenine formamidase